LVLVPERDKVFTTLTVEENLAVVSSKKHGSGSFARLGEVEALFPVLADRRRQIAGYLSGGERQMLAIAKALLLSPRVLMVDELSFGLAPKVVETLMQTLVDVHGKAGTAILLVEQNALAALSIADYSYVLENGRVVFDGTPARVHEHEDIRDSTSVEETASTTSSSTSANGAGGDDGPSGTAWRRRRRARRRRRVAAFRRRGRSEARQHRGAAALDDRDHRSQRCRQDQPSELPERLLPPTDGHDHVRQAEPDQNGPAPDR
jgi:ABC-type multidrug transport system ATPase subunit